MKAETLIQIGRITALIVLFIILTIPPLFVYGAIELYEKEVAPKEALFIIGISYMFYLPLVSILAGFAWALKRNKQKTAIVLFVLCVLWGILSGIANGIAGLVINVIIIVLLLQGILGIRKMQMSAMTSDVSGTNC